jgi:hypothetical protein
LGESAPRLLANLPVVADHGRQVELARAGLGRLAVSAADGDDRGSE